MRTHCSIRIATADDAAAIVEMIRGLADYEHKLSAVCATPAIIAEQMRSADPPFECLLAEEDGNLLGFALFFRAYSTWLAAAVLFLEDLFVAPTSRGHGVGGALMRRLAAISLERGWKRIEWLVLDWNTPAQGFYAEHGAERMKGWQVWSIEGEKLMRLAKGGQP
jgi:GNAT superfamily N-acetyltransferase